MKKIIALPILILAASSAHAGSIFGLAMEGGIYSIDTTTGNSTKVYDTISVPSVGSVNGLAYDGNGTFYYNYANTLYKNGGTESTLLKGISSNENATFYNGQYVYVSGANALKSLDLGTLKSTTFTVSGLLGSGFGDIASDANGKVWSQANSPMQTFDLNDLASGATTLASTGVSSNLQIGFDASGSLFGISYTSGKIYSIDTLTGARTWTGGVANYGGSQLHINDAASAAPVPEPASMAALALGIAGVLRRRKK